MYFRKFFKFPVSKPLDVRTKFYNAEVIRAYIGFDSCFILTGIFFFQSDDVFLEAQIQNTTQVPMTLERVSLEPSELYTCRELNVTEPSDGYFI